MKLVAPRCFPVQPCTAQGGYSVLPILCTQDSSPWRISKVSETLLALLLEAQGRHVPTLQREAEAKSLITVTLTGFFPPGPELPRGTEEFFCNSGCGSILLRANLE